MTKFGQELLEMKEAGTLLDKGSFKMLWHYSYYDGPMTGIGMVGAQFCYFVMTSDHHWKRIYAVYSLSLDEFKEELFSHEMFRMYVGLNTDYHFPGRDRYVGILHPRSEWDKFYKDPSKQNDETNYTDREPLGHFVM